MKSALRIGNKIIAVEHPEGTELVLDGSTLSARGHRSLEHELKEELGKQGLQFGDALAWATKKAGFQQCAGCVKRQYLMNHTKQNGIINTVREIVKTFRGKQ